MDRAKFLPASLPSRRRLLQSAALATLSTALLPSTRAGAEPRAIDHPQSAWFPASPSNRTVADRPTSHPIDFVVIHVTQETYPDTLAIFQNPEKQVSAHYVVRSGDGHITQMVRERDIAWHAGNWDYNTRSIGIEHEGWVDKPAYFTDALYEESARLTATICDKYALPKDRSHIIAHYEVPGSDHTDPGPYWDWTRCIGLVNSA